MVAKLLTVATALALSAGVPAHAQMAVVDAKAIVQLKSQLDQMRAQYRELQRTYQAIARLPSNAVKQLGRDLDRYRSVVPDARSVDGMLSGRGQLSARGRQVLGQNRVYAPQGADFQAREMARTATSIAAAQALATDLYAASTGRIDALRAIEAQLASAPDQKAVLDLQARVQAEQAYIQASQVQAQSLSLWQASQARSDQQRREEQRRQEIDSLIEQAKARGG